MRFIVLTLIVSTLAGRDASGQQAADTSDKSPATAGALSYFLPGVGSAYAGNGHHGAVHGGIAIGFAVVGLVSEAGRCPNDYCEGPITGVGGVAFLGYLTNMIWSTVTAVRDAREHNARAVQLRARTRGFAPALDIASASRPTGRACMCVRLAQLAF